MCTTTPQINVIIQSMIFPFTLTYLFNSVRRYFWQENCFVLKSTPALCVRGLTSGDRCCTIDFFGRFTSNTMSKEMQNKLPMYILEGNHSQYCGVPLYFLTDSHPLSLSDLFQNHMSTTSHTISAHAQEVSDKSNKD